MLSSRPEGCPAAANALQTEAVYLSVCKWCGTLLESIPKGPIFVLPDQVLESPNSSYAWIRYMAHHMGVGEIDKARGVAERALKTINFRCSPRPFFFSLSRAFACPL